MYHELPADLGVLDPFNQFITIETSNESYLGNLNLKIVFTGQDFIGGQYLETLFKVFIVPEPVVIDTTQAEAILVDISLIARIGEDWSQELPPLPRANQFYSQVDTGAVNSFITYNDISQTLVIDPSKTNSEQEGETYEIKLTILDEFGNIEQISLFIKMQAGADVEDESTFEQ